MQHSFPKLKLIAVGKIKKMWVKEGLALYEKRLPELDIVEIKDSDAEKEASQILTMVKNSERMIVLTEDGRSQSSIEFAHWISQQPSNALVFIIGGPDGISPTLKQQAHQRLSLSAMTFPHEIARLLLVEQLYRAKTILQGSSYHK